VGCATADTCGEAERLLIRLRSDLARDSGIAELASLEIRGRGVELDITGTLPRGQLGPFLAQLLLP
jgi:hypothetical protein